MHATGGKYQRRAGTIFNPTEALMQPEPPAVGTRTFTDGTTRTVFLDLVGRQYVLDDDGRRLYGTWILPQTPNPNPR